MKWLVKLIDYLSFRARRKNISYLNRTGKEGRILRKLNQWFRNDWTLTSEQKRWLA